MLIRPRFWKKVAQHGRIIEDALYVKTFGEIPFVHPIGKSPNKKLYKGWCCKNEHD